MLRKFDSHHGHLTEDTAAGEVYQDDRSLVKDCPRACKAAMCTSQQVLTTRASLNCRMFFTPAAVMGSTRRLVAPQTATWPSRMVGRCTSRAR